MTLRLQIIIAIIVVAAIFGIVNMVRKGKIDLRYALAWILLGVLILVFVIFPRLLIVLSDLFGVAAPVNMVFFVGFCIAIAVIYSQSVSISKLSYKVKKLTQELAIMKQQIEDKNEE